MPTRIFAAMFRRAPTEAEKLQAQVAQAKLDLRTARLEAVKATATVQWREAHLAALNAEHEPSQGRGFSM